MLNQQGHLFAIRWIDKESKGYVDVFPASEFAREGTKKELTHMVLGPKGGQHQAKCRLVVKGKTAYLHYEDFLEFNDSWEMSPGVLRLLFESVNRDKLIKVFWKTPKGKSFVPGLAEIVSNPLPNRKPYNFKKGKRSKSLQFIAERPGQGKFRNELMIAYSGKCCISGCSVPAVLEGSHIDPFSGEESDHPGNGLLLRKDLHALFDEKLLAIDPKSRLVHIAKSAQTFSEYKALHLTARLSIPAYGGVSYKPSEEALMRRWLDFKKIDG